MTQDWDSRPRRSNRDSPLRTAYPVNLKVHFDELAAVQRIGADFALVPIAVFASIHVEKPLRKPDMNRTRPPAPIASPSGPIDVPQQNRRISTDVVRVSLCRAADRKLTFEH